MGHDKLFFRHVLLYYFNLSKTYVHKQYGPQNVCQNIFACHHLRDNNYVARVSIYGFDYHLIMIVRIWQTEYSDYYRFIYSSRFLANLKSRFILKFKCWFKSKFVLFFLLFWIFPLIPSTNLYSNNTPNHLYIYTGSFHW